MDTNRIIGSVSAELRESVPDVQIVIHGRQTGKSAIAKLILDHLREHGVRVIEEMPKETQPIVLDDNTLLLSLYLAESQEELSAPPLFQFTGGEHG